VDAHAVAFFHCAHDLRVGPIIHAIYLSVRSSGKLSVEIGYNLG
jgi:hypothetical protein